MPIGQSLRLTLKTLRSDDHTIDESGAESEGNPNPQPLYTSAACIFRAGLIEAWGRGIERIMQACLDAGVPTPEVSCDVNGLWMAFHFLPEHQTGGTTLETTQETIIKLIKSNPAMTQKGLSDKTGLTVDGVKYHLKKLKDAGMIKRIGSTKAGSWEVLNDSE